MKKYLSLLFVLAISTIAVQALAQAPQVAPNTISCSEISKSVDVKISAQNSKSSSGTRIDFSGSIANNNPYPIVGGKVIVIVSKKDDSDKKSASTDMVDSFVVSEDMTIKANSSTPINFYWNIPAYAISGEYQIKTNLTANTGYNLTNQVSNSNDTEFKVFGEQTTDVHLDASEIKINGNVLAVEKSASLGAEEKGDIIFTVINSTDKMQEVPFSIELYKWNDQIKQNLLKTDIQTYLLKPKSSFAIPYVFDNDKFSTYFVHASATYKDAKSELAANIKRVGVKESPIILSALSGYPIIKGKENSIVTCIDGNNYSKVETTITDSEGAVIDKTEAVLGVTKFVPKSSYKNIIIETKVFDKSGNIMDQIKAEYKCKDLMDDCSESVIGFNFINLKLILITLGVLIVLIISFIFGKKLFLRKDQSMV